jgi:hypothetical protein
MRSRFWSLGDRSENARGRRGVVSRGQSERDLWLGLQISRGKTRLHRPLCGGSRPDSDDVQRDPRSHPDTGRKAKNKELTPPSARLGSEEQVSRTCATRNVELPCQTDPPQESSEARVRAA